MANQPPRFDHAVRTEIGSAVTTLSGPSAGSQWPLVERRHRTTDRRQESRPVARSGSDISQACTVREQQIVQLLLQGMTNKAIAQQLGIVEDTVKKHLQHIYDKLGIRRRALLMLERRGGRLTVSP